jgi:hypothetical protein
MKTFTIDNSSTSFKYLSRWRSDYSWIKIHGADDDNWYYSQLDIARDFCSYYRHVAILMLIQFFLLLGIPAALYFILSRFGLTSLPIDKLGEHNIKFSILLFLKLMFCGYGLLTLMLVAAFSVVYFIKELIPKFIRYTISKFSEKVKNVDKPKKVKVDKGPGFVATWYDGVKHNYCPTLTYDIKPPTETP